MKVLSDGEILFKPSKSKIFWKRFKYPLVGVLLCFFMLLLITKAIVVLLSYIVLVGGLMFLSVLFYFALTVPKFTVAVNNEAVKIVKTSVYLSDITSIRRKKMYSKDFLMIKVRDIKKYKLGYVEKINLRVGKNPFFINLSILPEGDGLRLENLLRSKTADNIPF